MDTVFIVEIVRLIFSPVSKIVWLSICPGKRSLAVSVIQSNPALGAIQTMLYIDVLLLIFNAGEVCAV